MESMRYTVSRFDIMGKDQWMVRRDNSEHGLAPTISFFDTVGKALYYIKKRIE